MITPEQARTAAKSLFPEVYATDRIGAILKAVEWLREAEAEQLNYAVERPDGSMGPAFPQATTLPKAAPVEVDYKERKIQARGLMKRLSVHMKAEGITANQLAAELSVKPMTLRTWLQGSYIPRGENMDKILAYIARLKL